ncbi:hypothetical protein GCM10007872_19490 [Gluconobacter sphaericus NBRC 12467]|uniref:Large ribosomal subunit protein bL35 n=10 Tax=Gluconobacter TaxID=441 RepID=A0AA37WC51_9PROT|nr:50S ribosomal protein L35 [Gluconobacter sphaericus NBRC 12467]GBR68371.1 50S ribosomal protein L35 [Gluconobacter kanchanaburiensis NBRC 103587]GEB42214.1 hypothetical protein GSP01_09960 [Gluconobacter sphaericus NBRC 12467]GEK95842.1 hypothetical protein GKA01_10390 [Gluconobacter kanchanaburiensis NBRC 103587]GLQ84804.1 hypothetical protein GCM10007872_17120 [Gluconobacter sphaericus NBRC 12467]
MRLQNTLVSDKDTASAHASGPRVACPAVQSPYCVQDQSFTARETEMPKMKTKSSVKKRFKITATGKVMCGPGNKRHGLINRPQKMKRTNRGPQTMTDMDAKTIKQWAPYGL